MSRKSVGLALVLAGGLSAWTTPSARAQTAPVVSKNDSAALCAAPTVAYWRFDGNYFDACGSLHGTAAGSASLDVANVAPIAGNTSSLLLDGINSRVDLPAQFGTSVGSLPEGTIEAWLYLSGAGGVIFNHGVAAISTDLQFSVLAGTTRILRLHTTAAGNFDFALTGFLLNQWHHVACNWKPGTVRAYLDGMPIGTINGNLNITWGGNEAEIGSDDQEVGYWPGRLDEVRLSNRALESNELLIGDLRPSLVLNGEFEFNASGWSLISHAAANWYNDPGWDGVQGCFFVNDISGGHPETNQLVTGLAPGWRYLVSGYYRRESQNWPPLNFRVLLDDAIHFQAGGTVVQGWTPFSFLYVATDGDMRLRFQSQLTGDDAYFIDHISMVKVDQVVDGNTPLGMVLIPGGQFLMGDESGVGDLDELPRHDVRLSSFFMDRYEVTNAQYAAALNWAYQHGLIYVSDGVVYGNGNDLGYCDTDLGSSAARITWDAGATKFGVIFAKENHPMVRVSWYGAAAYANWRGEMEGRGASYTFSGSDPNWNCNFLSGGYRLPTEAEWEYAARGGASGHRFPWSDSNDIQHARANYYSDPSYPYDTSPTRGFHPTFNTGGLPYTSPVGYFAPNGYGVYDMAGNVWEWCNDWLSKTYYESSPSSNPTGPVSGSDRVLRGGGWFRTAVFCRCANRNHDYYGPPSSLHGDVGFRLALPVWAVLQNSQPQPGTDPQPNNKISLERLWEWDDNSGRFVDPGPAGVTIDPAKPTYLLTHGWDGNLNGEGCEIGADNFAMSSIGCAIAESTNGTANLLAWDWHENANPNGECDFPDVFVTETAEALLDALVHAISRGPQAALIGLAGDIGLTIGKIIFDARQSGNNAATEGNLLGQALADQLRAHDGSLGTELHLIGKSHGGGVMGRVAKKLAEQGHPATSLTTLDTPKVGCLGRLGCVVNSLKNVEPAAMLPTDIAVYYYPELHGGGFGADVRGTFINLTNLELNPDLNPHHFSLLHPTDTRWIDHLWIAGEDNGVCPAQTPTDDGWYPTGLRTEDAPTFDNDSAATSLLDVVAFPFGCFVEGDSQFHFSEQACEAVAGTSEENSSDTAGMSIIAFEPFQSANSWSGNLAQLVIGADPADATNRVILMQEQGDASFFKDISWPAQAVVITFDYMFREPRGNENLTVYVDNQIVYYDNAETTLAHDHLTSSGAVYVGNVAGQTKRLNFVFRTDVPDGSTLGGELVIDNIRVYGFLEHDADLDGDRDLFDFAAFQRCFGHGFTTDDPLPDECWAFDVDGVDGVGAYDYSGLAADPPHDRGFVQFLSDPATGGPRVVPPP